MRHRRVGATIARMNTSAAPSLHFGERVHEGIRRGIRRVLARVSGRTPGGRGESGAVLVEFAIIFPLLITITFGIIEFSSAYHDSAITADATRAGGRVGSAIATDPAYTTDIVQAVDAALSTLPANEPQQLWIYKADTLGYPGTGNDFSSCAANCIAYNWNSSAKAFDMSNPSGAGWPASTHQVCTEPYDELGVYVKIDHTFITGLFGADVSLQDHAVFRFEPVPSSVCATP
jgi:Flp pilus assembly protein TadG